MRVFAIVALSALVACKPAERRADSVQPVDTLKAAPPSDTLASAPRADSTATKTPATKTPPSKTPTTKTKSTIIGRDSAFPPPRRLPQLDTVRRRPPG